MKNKMKKGWTVEQMAKEGMRLKRQFAIWGLVARITRFGIYGLVLRRIDALNRRAALFNVRCAQLGKEQKRLAAMMRKRGY